MFDYILGIDPGLSGGIALIHNKADPVTVNAVKMPETEKDIISELEPIFKAGSVVAYLEKVHAMPKQGVTSSFTFGKGYGFLRGVLLVLGARLENVPPQTWQKALGCLTKGDKNVSKSKAQEMFPHLKITHATADALLIAEFGRRAEALSNQFEA